MLGGEQPEGGFCSRWLVWVLVPAFVLACLVWKMIGAVAQACFATALCFRTISDSGREVVVVIVKTLPCRHGKSKPAYLGPQFPHSFSCACTSVPRHSNCKARNVAPARHMGCCWSMYYAAHLVR